MNTVLKDGVWHGTCGPTSCGASHEEISSAAIEDLETKTRGPAELMRVVRVSHATI